MNSTFLSALDVILNRKFALSLYIIKKMEANPGTISFLKNFPGFVLIVCSLNLEIYVMSLFSPRFY